MIGELQGGWNYVWAAYIVVWAGLFLYGGSLVRQRLSKGPAVPPAGGNDAGER